MTKQYNDIQRLYQNMVRWLFDVFVQLTIKFDRPMHLQHARDMPVICCNVLQCALCLGIYWPERFRALQDREKPHGLQGSD